VGCGACVTACVSAMQCLDPLACSRVVVLGGTATTQRALQVSARHSEPSMASTGAKRSAGGAAAATPAAAKKPKHADCDEPAEGDADLQMLADGILELLRQRKAGATC
jgi:hypothetical protein